ncbi:hypothetical protein K2F45_23005 [Sphingobacterium siyangense]|uniref:hypothetical protein n=1 Tax=Sphingobacterium siyangense TaxID=459529 RepID=UPI00200C2FD5|nr:hypothetical protein [Sphingobacterium siyangense]UQA74634.1 hypothetical protein K2F45_23005 [Sphingobacterium siyangense]
MIKIKLTLTLLAMFYLMVELYGQQFTKPLLQMEKLESIRREFVILKDGKGNTYVHVKGQPNAGVVWIKDILFETGTIEFDVRGKDVLQESFVGIAFHGTNDTTYQALYFRPFNFRAKDPIRKKHAVQYISLPDNDWPYLREEFPDIYEASMPTVIDPNDWFNVKIVVTKDTINTFVNSLQTSVLTVKSLHKASSGKIGFWTGNDSDGDFANLKITFNK